MKHLVYTTKSKGEICLLLPEEKQRIQFSTGKLRTSPAPMLKRLRQLFAEKGVDVSSAILAQFFPDGQSLVFGILVTSDGEVFQFDYDWLYNEIGAGYLKSWKRIPEEYPDRIWGEQIKLALEIIEEAKENSCADQEPL